MYSCKGRVFPLKDTSQIMPSCPYCRLNEQVVQMKDDYTDLKDKDPKKSYFCYACGKAFKLAGK
jgi:transposase-like protein